MALPFHPENNHYRGVPPLLVGFVMFGCWVSVDSSHRAKSEPARGRRRPCTRGRVG